MVYSECIEGELRSALIDGLRKLKGLPFKPSHLMDFKNHETESMAGWIGLTSWTVQTNDCQLWDVDWRYAFGSEVFKQNLIDFGLDEQKFLYRYKRKDQKCHKLVIYICYSGMDMPEYYSGFTDGKKDKHLNSHTLEIPTWNPIPERYLIGKFWQSVHRCLIPIEILPLELQQLLPETLPKSLEFLCGDFSTTRTLQNKPKERINNEEDEVQTVIALERHPKRRGEGGLRTKSLYKYSGNVDSPLISVITVVYNDINMLEQTIQSVINQTDSIIEYIVIDGGSTDGTLDIIRQYENQIDYWVSEPDKGIYDAMNKGLTLVTGDWLIFINSGDYLKEVPNTNNADIVYGATLVRYPHKTRLVKPRSLPSIYKGAIASHQSMLFSNNCYKTFKYNLKYKYAADYELILKFRDHRYNFKMTQDIISMITSGGVSDKERITVHFEYLDILESMKIKQKYHIFYNIVRDSFVCSIKK